MTDATSNPRPGMLATVRNRRGLVTSVEPFDGGTEGQFHLTTVEFLDADGPEKQSLIWEREPDARLTEPAALPSSRRDRPMDPDQFDAVPRAAWWMAVRPLLDPDGKGPLDALPLTAFFIGLPEQGGQQKQGRPPPSWRLSVIVRTV